MLRALCCFNWVSDNGRLKTLISQDSRYNDLSLSVSFSIIKCMSPFTSLFCISLLHDDMLVLVSLSTLGCALAFLNDIKVLYEKNCRFIHSLEEQKILWLTEGLLERYATLAQLGPLTHPTYLYLGPEVMKLGAEATTFKLEMQVPPSSVFCTHSPDSYSLGLILFELVTEKQPFVEHFRGVQDERDPKYKAAVGALYKGVMKGDRPKVLERFPIGLDIGERIPEALKSLIESCLEANPEGCKDP
ncbi:hypothetical protein Pelo_19173 [Pelomyxa schiedti]|nr:hypothetical protein Pelo_19173 [Pelomyxa schiedti]